MTDAFLLLLRAHDVPLPDTEFKFHPTRRWRFDYYWEPLRLAIEREGAVWTRGRHTRGNGYIKDMEKYNTAALMGITVLRFTPQQLLETETLETVKRLVGRRG